MQITTSKSSGASAETEICTYGDWTSAGEEEEGCMYSPPLLSHPQLCLCHASLQKTSFVLLSWFNLAPFAMLNKSETEKKKNSPGILER